MAILDDVSEQEVRKNKAIRGYIIRSLANGNDNTLMVRQIANTLVADRVIVSPDISKYLNYLVESGYIEFTNRKVSAYKAYRCEAVIRLTKKGTDLVEDTIQDPGVEV